MVEENGLSCELIALVLSALDEDDGIRLYCSADHGEWHLHIGIADRDREG